LCARHPRDLAMAYSAADVERNFKAGKISCLIGIEGGHAIENSLGALRMFAALGVRYITLTHWRSLPWATASTDTARRGLSAFGRDVVHEMNRLGILVDLSHVNDATMSDALHTTRAPVMFSHSSARALTGHARDVPDSILKLVPKNGGIVMVNFNPGFVSEAVRLYDDSMEARIHSLRAAGVDPTTVGDSTKAWAARAPKATLAQVADHIEHLRDVAGVDAVGLGSDFDGITEVPVGLEDVSKFPDLIAELLRRGWSEQDVKKVAGLNALRVLRAAELAAARMEACLARCFWFLPVLLPACPLSRSLSWSSPPTPASAGTPTRTPGLATTRCAGGSRSSRASRTAAAGPDRRTADSAGSSPPRAPRPRATAASRSPTPRARRAARSWCSRRRAAARPM